MAIEIYLGNPPAYITDWIRNHSQPASHPKTRFILEGGTVEEYDIVGTLDQNWLDAHGLWVWAGMAWEKNIISIEIGSTVTSIGFDAFNSCSSLTSMTIPDSVTSIGASAFVGCDSLMSVTITANGGNAENVKQMLIDADVSSSITWNMPN